MKVYEVQVKAKGKAHSPAGVIRDLRNRLQRALRAGGATELTHLGMNLRDNSLRILLHNERKVQERMGYESIESYFSTIMPDVPYEITGVNIDQALNRRAKASGAEKQIAELEERVRDMQAALNKKEEAHRIALEETYETLGELCAEEKQKIAQRKDEEHAESIAREALKHQAKLKSLTESHERALADCKDQYRKLEAARRADADAFGEQVDRIKKDHNKQLAQYRARMSGGDQQIAYQREVIERRDALLAQLAAEEGEKLQDHVFDFKKLRGATIEAVYEHARKRIILREGGLDVEETFENDEELLRYYARELKDLNTEDPKAQLMYALHLEEDARIDSIVASCTSPVPLNLYMRKEPAQLVVLLPHISEGKRGFDTVMKHFGEEIAQEVGVSKGVELTPTFRSKDNQIIFTPQRGLHTIHSAAQSAAYAAQGQTVLAALGINVKVRNY